MAEKNIIIYFAIQSTLKMEEKNYLSDITDIKNMMRQSSQFISLSGLSGVLAGIYALCGAAFANHLLSSYDSSQYTSLTRTNTLTEDAIIKNLTLIALVVIALSLASGIILSAKKANSAGEKLWNVTSKKLAVNFLIPLTTGGVFALLMIDKMYYDLIAPATLIFYGLACVNASKNTFRDVRYLGITIIVIGLVSTAIPGHSLLLWALGFGVCHIFYGAMMYFKYDRNPS